MPSHAPDQTIEWVIPLTSFFAALIGVFVAHYFTNRRDVANKRREILVKSKMELWKLLDQNNGLAADSIGSGTSNPKEWEAIVRETQLLGTDEQIKLVNEITDQLKSQTEIPQYAQLMKSLQNELRQELGMKETKHPYFWLRIKTSDLQAQKDIS